MVGRPRELWRSRRRGRGHGRLVLVVGVDSLRASVVVSEVELAAQAAGERVDLARRSSGREDRLEALLEDLAKIGAIRHRGGESS